MVVVLAGDAYGNRILEGAALVDHGFAPHALISGPRGFYGMHESDLAIPFAVKAGYPQDFFIPFPNDAKSTADEAEAIVEELRKRNVRSIDLVTSDYHTRRAGRIYRAIADGIDVHVVAARDENFRQDSWWRTREGKKVFAIEWMKTIAGWLGI
ncbi:MAG: YdcF family protein [Bryobacteraceae bacterium]